MSVDRMKYFISFIVFIALLSSCTTTSSDPTIYENMEPRELSTQEIIKVVVKDREFIEKEIILPIEILEFKKWLTTFSTEPEVRSFNGKKSIIIIDAILNLTYILMLADGQDVYYLPPSASSITDKLDLKVKGFSRNNSIYAYLKNGKIIKAYYKSPVINIGNSYYVKGVGNYDFFEN